MVPGTGIEPARYQVPADFETADKELPIAGKCLKMRVWLSPAVGLVDKKKKASDGLFRFLLDLVGYILSYILAPTAPGGGRKMIRRTATNNDLVIRNPSSGSHLPAVTSVPQ